MQQGGVGRRILSRVEDRRLEPELEETTRTDEPADAAANDGDGGALGCRRLLRGGAGLDGGRSGHAALKGLVGSRHCG